MSAIAVYVTVRDAVVGGGRYPVVAVTMKVELVAPVNVPDSTPDRLNESPAGSAGDVKDWMERPLVVVTINW